MTQSNVKHWINWFFKSKEGKWTVFQWPNILLLSWIALIFINLFIKDQRLKQLQSAVLFAWAYTELMYGDSYFRKVLGVVVLLVLIVGYLA